MTTPNTIRRILVYGLVSCAVLTGISFFISYECFRSYCPRQPKVETGQIYPERLQQPFDVYLTKFEVEWLDYGLVGAMVPFAAAFYLNSRWKIIHNSYYDIPKKMY